jgi:DNA-directed RNA polymerase specialized sigma24 family protein
MSEEKGSFKRKEDFSPEEWVEIYKKALRLRLKKKLSPAKIGKILNISPDTVATWIYGSKQTLNEVGREDWDEVYRLRCKI